MLEKKAVMAARSRRLIILVKVKKYESENNFKNGFPSSKIVSPEAKKKTVKSKFFEERLQDF